MSGTPTVLEPSLSSITHRTQDGSGVASYLSREEFEVFVREYLERLRAVAARMLRSADDADDAVQDALLAAFTARHRFRGQSTVYTWLYRIVTNACLMKLRSRRSRKRQGIELSQMLPEVPLEIADTTDFPPSARLELTEEVEVIRARLSQLSNDYRIVLELRDVEGLNTSETALRLSLSQEAVKTRVCRARQALRLLLETASAGKNPCRKNQAKLTISQAG